MIRPKTTAQTTEERQVIARLQVLAEQKRRIEAEIYSEAQKARDMKLPADMVAEAAGLSRATLYRKLDELTGRKKGATKE